MRTHRLVLSVLVALVLWPAAALGQSPELLQAYDRSSELYGQGRYQEAILYAQDALRLGERELGPDHPTTATLLNNLAWLLQYKNDKQALEHAEKAFNLSPEDPDILDTYGWVLSESGQLDLGLSYIRQALSRSSKDPAARSAPSHAGFRSVPATKRPESGL